MDSNLNVESKTLTHVKKKREEDLQDGRGVGCGDQLPPTNISKIHLHVEQLL